MSLVFGKLNFKNSKIILTVGLLIALLLGFSLLSFFQNDSQDDPAENTSDFFSGSGSLVVNTNIDKKLSVSISSISGQILQTALTQELIQLQTGKYNVSIYSDQYGQAEEQIEIQDQQELTIDLALDSKENNSIDQDYKVSANPLNSQNFEETSSDSLSKISEQLNTGQKLVTITQAKENTSLALIADPTTGRGDIKLNLGDQTSILGENCLLFRSEVNSAGDKFVYFKTCLDDQEQPIEKESGYFVYDLKTQTNKLVYPSTDYTDAIKIAINPADNSIVFVDNQKNFGFIDTSTGELKKQTDNYSLFGLNLFDSNNNLLSSQVLDFYQLSDGQIFFQIHGYLYRIQDNQLILAYSEPLTAVEVTQDNLGIVSNTGQINEFKIVKR